MSVFLGQPGWLKSGDSQKGVGGLGGKAEKRGMTLGRYVFEKTAHSHSKEVPLTLHEYMKQKRYSWLFDVTGYVI